MGSEKSQGGAGSRPESRGASGSRPESRAASDKPPSRPRTPQNDIAIPVAPPSAERSGSPRMESPMFSPLASPRGPTRILGDVGVKVGRFGGGGDARSLPGLAEIRKKLREGMSKAEYNPHPEGFKGAPNLRPKAFQKSIVLVRQARRGPAYHFWSLCG